jgi:putative FmdB family regulatory protein
MPIYAYRCEACGFAKDVLQKMSDDTLTICPTCGKDAFRKQVTAAGFQLKGSGWYVTDFRNGSGGAAVPPVAGGAGGEGGNKEGNKDGNKDGGKSGDSTTPAAAAAPAAGSSSDSSAKPAAATVAAPAPAGKPAA